MTRTILAATAAGLMLAAGTAAQADTLTYENGRFGTSVTFPAEIFRESMDPPQNGDGMTFLSRDGASLAVFGMNNALAVSPEEMAEQASQERSDPTYEVTYKRVGEDWFVLSGHEDGRIFYQRFEFGADDVIHGLLIKYPPETRETYDALVGGIAASFGGP